MNYYEKCRLCLGIWKDLEDRFAFILHKTFA